MDEHKTYLGDGAYASFDGYQIKLTAENGITATDTIYLEPQVMASLVTFASKFMKLPQVKTEATA
jgi:hypothetical protein